MKVGAPSVHDVVEATFALDEIKFRKNESGRPKLSPRNPAGSGDPDRSARSLIMLVFD